MFLNEMLKILEAELINNINPYVEIKVIYGSDLMSDVLTFVEPGALLLTGLTNSQVVRTAEMAEIIAVCFVSGKKPQNDTIKLAEKIGLPLLMTEYSMYKSCGLLYGEGLCGRGDEK